MALLVFDITPKAMKKIVNSCNKASKAETIRKDFTAYLKRQEYCSKRKSYYRESTTRQSRIKQFYKRLNKKEKDMLRNLETGFINCDPNFLYKLTKQYKLVEPPTHGWNGKVDHLETYGDLVETFRQMRNAVFHLPNIKILEKDFHYFKNNIFKTVTVVSKECEKHMELYHEMKNHITWPL